MVKEVKTQRRRNLPITNCEKVSAMIMLDLEVHVGEFSALRMCVITLLLESDHG